MEAAHFDDAQDRRSSIFGRRSYDGSICQAALANGQTHLWFDVLFVQREDASNARADGANGCRQVAEMEGMSNFVQGLKEVLTITKERDKKGKMKRRAELVTLGKIER
jgi:hypothetical protein